MIGTFGSRSATKLSAIAFLLLSACAYNGPVTATNGSTATGGTSTVNVTNALGSDAVKAVSDAVMAALNPLHGVATPAQKDAAVKAGVNAGLAKAQNQGKQVDAKTMADLHALAMDQVNKATSSQ